MEANIKGFRQHFKWFWRIIRHGLFFQGFRNRLARIGIDIMPYYWVQEAVTPVIPPKIKDESDGYSVSFFDQNDVEYIIDNIKGLHFTQTEHYFDENQWCIGVKKNNEIAAYMLVQFSDFDFRGRTIPINSNEAYLNQMYTFEAFRGKNIAPYLRFQCYEMLREKGILNIYSITEYLNKSSKRFKRKLNSEYLSLWLSIQLFGRYTKNIKIKDFRNKLDANTISKSVS
ncbi:GNAT family N-acetyltransferase [Flagellimonas sp.]|uniref:GNAT family N-acetyltransferase n=1 Tax=Flagellimonas sp. TaxID=2058762 RepID=UPI003F49EA2C